MLLRPALAARDLHLITAAAGLAAVEVCAEEGVREARLKWPNDVIVPGADGPRKLAGLLAEALVDAGRVSAMVVGMGLNVNWGREVPNGGVALNELLRRPVMANRVLERWLRSFGERYELLRSVDGQQGVRDEHRLACATIGQLVQVHLAGDVVVGVAEGIDDEGRLVVRGDERHVFDVGDIVHVRAVSDT